MNYISNTYTTRNNNSINIQISIIKMSKITAD